MHKRRKTSIDKESWNPNLLYKKINLTNSKYLRKNKNRSKPNWTQLIWIEIIITADYLSNLGQQW
jgi:hypothetical protein